MTDKAEAAKLWSLMLQLERVKCKTEADFNMKKKEMAKLQAAYEKASGMNTDPNDHVLNRVRGEHKFMKGLAGRPSDGGRDDMNDEIPFYDPNKT